MSDKRRADHLRAGVGRVMTGRRLRHRLVVVAVLAVTWAGARATVDSSLLGASGSNAPSLAQQPSHAVHLPAARNRQPFAPRLVAQVGGDIVAAAVRGRHAVVNLGKRWAVVDLMRPGAIPTPIPFVLDTPTYTYGGSVALGNAHAYITTIAGGFVVVDVSEISVPRVVASLTTNDRRIDAVVSAEPYVLLTNGGYIRTVDVTVPTMPSWVDGYYRVPDGTIIRSLVARGNVYFAGTETGVRSVDYTTPADPIDLGLLPLPATALAVQHDLLMVLSPEGVLSLVDVHEPASPRALGTVAVCAATSWGHLLSGAGRTAYVACAPANVGGRAHLAVIDVSNAATPRVLGRMFLREIDAHQLVYDDGTLHVVGATGITMVDVVEASAPKLAGVYPSLGDAGQLAADGNHLYVDDPGGGRVWTFDISQPAWPVPSCVSSQHYYATTLFARDGVGYMTGAINSQWATGASVGAPGVVATLDLSRCYDSVTVLGQAESALVRHAVLDGDVIVGTTRHEGLRVFDVSVPAEPTEIASLQFEGDTQDLAGIALARGKAYVADAGGHVLHVVDLSDPAAPGDLGRTHLSRPTLVLELGDRLFVVDEPSVEMSLDAQGWPHVNGGIDHCCPEALDRTSHHVVTLGHMLSFIDVREPGQMKFDGRVDTPSRGRDVLVANDHVYASLGYNGLAVVSLRP